MSKYKLNEKYTVHAENGEPKLTKKYRRKSSTKGDFHSLKTRSLSLGALNSPKLTVVEIQDMPHSPLEKTLSTSPSMDFTQLINVNLTSKGNPYTHENMYGFKVNSVIGLIVNHSKKIIVLIYISISDNLSWNLVKAF